MKILNSSQIKEADAFTIEHEPISSIDLMERASSAFTSWFTNKFAKGRSVMIFCGMGNNGGDGLAIGRLLLEMKYGVQLFVIKAKETGSPDFEENRRRFSQISAIHYVTEAVQLPVISPENIVIDAIFGSGLDRPVTGIYAAVIHYLNSRTATKIAVDIASGLLVDEHSHEGAIFSPDYSITFQVPKLAFMMPENAAYTGQVEIVDIGLNTDFIKGASTPYCLTTQDLVKPFLKERKRFAHKGDFGRVLLISGSWGKMGAAVLCAKACLRAGTGLLTIHIPTYGYEVLQATVPEAMVEPDIEKKRISRVKDFEKYDAIGVGPGIGTDDSTGTMLAAVLKGYKKPMVLDADALNILGANKMWLKSIPKNSILTPHPKEFERIAGKFRNDFERLSLQKKFSKRYSCIVILKGANTSISTPSGEVYFNSTGNPGMATGGSGDVLTGMLAALLGQGYEPLEAALLGVYLHGLAGDLAAEKLGFESLLPSDLIDHIYAAYGHLKNSKTC